MHERRTSILIYLATALSVGHHLDHAIRGNHVGWPLSAEVTPFTFSLGVYPLILLGLVLSRAEKAGPGYWLSLFGVGAVFLTAVHLGPTAIEPPRDIIDLHQAALLGWLAFVELLLFLAVLAIAFVYELHLWRRRRARTTWGPVGRGSEFDGRGGIASSRLPRDSRPATPATP